MVSIMSEDYIEKVVSGVKARELILRRLLKGGASGLELRAFLEKELGPISETVAYYNLGRLYEAGLVVVSRKWREKIYEISPRWLQKIRNYLGIEVPVAYLGGFESEIPFSLRSRLRNFIGKDISWFILIVNESMRNRAKLYGAECIYVDDSIWDGSVLGVMPPIKQLVEEKLQKYELVIDVTNGSEPTKLALLQLAYEYNLKCFRYEKGRYVWLKE